MALLWLVVEWVLSLGSAGSPLVLIEATEVFREWPMGLKGRWLVVVLIILLVWNSMSSKLTIVVEFFLE